MDFQINHSEMINDIPTGTLTLDGALTIQRAEELKSFFLKALNSESHVVVRFDDVTEIDLSCLQLFCSAHRSFEESKMILTLDEPLPEALKQEVTEAGLWRPVSCSQNPDRPCLWIETKKE